jgi:hypothetical protein
VGPTQVFSDQAGNKNRALEKPLAGRAAGPTSMMWRIPDFHSQESPAIRAPRPPFTEAAPPVHAERTSPLNPSETQWCHLGKLANPSARRLLSGQPKVGMLSTSGSSLPALRPVCPRRTARNDQEIEQAPSKRLTYVHAAASTPRAPARRRRTNAQDRLNRQEVPNAELRQEDCLGAYGSVHTQARWARISRSACTVKRGYCPRG